MTPEEADIRRVSAGDSKFKRRIGVDLLAGDHTRAGWIQLPKNDVALCKANYHRMLSIRQHRETGDGRGADGRTLQGYFGGGTGRIGIPAQQYGAVSSRSDPDLIAIELQLRLLAGEGIPSVPCGPVEYNGLE